MTTGNGSAPDWKPDYVRKDLPKNIFNIGLILLAVGLVLGIIAYVTDYQRAMYNTVIFYTFILSVGIGSVFFVALEYVAGAVWSVPVRRTAEFLSALIFIAPVFAIPVLVDMRGVFHWMHFDQTDKLLAGKAPYLNAQFFIIRFVVTYIIWFIFYTFLMRNSARQDTTGNQRLTKQSIKFSAAFMPVFAITLSLMAVDWLMSLEPRWYSTIFGVYYFSGTVLASLAAITFASVTLNEKGLLIKGIKKDHYYSLGALLFAFVNFWAYIAFSQFMLIWYANLPEETFWFMQRWEGSWKIISIGLIFVRFIIPYALLLSQPSKMDSRMLKFASIWILFSHYYDLYWLVMPSYNDKGIVLGWMEFAFPILAAGLIVVVFNIAGRKRNLVPIGDPKLRRAMEFRL